MAHITPTATAAASIAPPAPLATYRFLGTAAAVTTGGVYVDVGAAPDGLAPLAALGARELTSVVLGRYVEAGGAGGGGVYVDVEVDDDVGLGGGGDVAGVVVGLGAGGGGGAGGVT